MSTATLQQKINRYTRDIVALDSMFVLPHAFYPEEQRLTYRCVACGAVGELAVDILHGQGCGYKYKRDEMAHVHRCLMRLQYMAEAFTVYDIRTDC